MHVIVQYVRSYFRTEWNAGLFLGIGSLLAVSFLVNYSFDVESAALRIFAAPHEQLVFFYFFYAIPYVLTLTLWAVVRRQTGILKQKNFWLLFQLCFTTLAAYITLHNLPGYLLHTHREILSPFPAHIHAYIVRSASNLLPGLIAAVPIAFYWYRHDRNDSRMYGFNTSNIRVQTYAVILLALVPVLLASSFTQDFREAYPRFKFGLPSGLPQPEQSFLITIFQFCYGIDFVFVEFFFRGFMVMAFTRFLGSGSILPMVVVYAFIHFQKPLGEALSSILGGLALGIISYNTKSIYGGVILHLGVAYLMELAGSLQYAL